MGSIINPVEKRGWSVSASGITITGKVKKYATYVDLMAVVEDFPFLAWVVDATADMTVITGSALYMYDPDNEMNYTKVYETELLDRDLGIIFKWEMILDKPTSAVEDIDAAVLVRHSHTNKGALDVLSTAIDGTLLVNGKNIITADQLSAYALSTDIAIALAAINQTMSSLTTRVTNLEIAANKRPVFVYTSTGTELEPYPLEIGKWYLFDGASIIGYLPETAANYATIQIDTFNSNPSKVYHSSFVGGYVDIPDTGSSRFIFNSVQNKWSVILT